MKFKNNFRNIRALLFENRTIKQTVFKNTFWLSLSEGITGLLSFILLIYIARILGATEYGKFSFALAIVTLFAAFSSFVHPKIVIREFSQKRDKEREFGSVLYLRFFLGLGIVILVFFSSFFVTADPSIRKIIWILALYILLDGFAEFINFFFEIRQQMEYEAGLRIFRALITTSFGLFVIFNFPSAENLSYGYLSASLIILVSVLIFFYFKACRTIFTINRFIWRKYLIISAPLALAGVFSTIVHKVDSTIMGYLGQLAETGFYNAAYRIIGGILIPINLVSTSFYPALNKGFSESKEKFKKIFDYQIIIMIFLAIPIVAGGIILAPKIISFIYGSNYIPSVLAFQILIFMAGISFLVNPLVGILYIFNQQIKFVWINLMGAGVNVVLNLYLIPRFSLYGAALTSVITYFFMFFLFIGFIKHFTSVKLLSSEILLVAIISTFSTFIMSFIISTPVIYNLPILFSITIGALTYFIVFFVLKVFLKKNRILINK